LINRFALSVAKAESKGEQRHMQRAV
jgi:hypothetical protein